jgi:hypothetical protein
MLPRRRRASYKSCSRHRIDSTGNGGAALALLRCSKAAKCRTWPRLPHAECVPRKPHARTPGGSKIRPDNQLIPVYSLPGPNANGFRGFQRVRSARRARRQPAVWGSSRGFRLLRPARHRSRTPAGGTTALTGNRPYTCSQNAAATAGGARPRRASRCEQTLSCPRPTSTPHSDPCSEPSSRPPETLVLLLNGRLIYIVLRNRRALGFMMALPHGAFVLP